MQQHHEHERLESTPRIANSVARMVTIALDVMGGDFGCGPAVSAALKFCEKSAHEIVLVGDENEIFGHTPSNIRSVSNLSISHTKSHVPQNVNAKTALDDYPHASIFESLKMVRSGEADIVVTTSATGAVIMGCAHFFKRLDGVRRGAIAAVLPTAARRGPKSDPFALVLDVGATLAASADDLIGFAKMGTAYATCISMTKRPKVAILSNGSEASKGRPSEVEAHERLSRIPEIEFCGRVEATDLPTTSVDIILTDGFTGNVVLKFLEGMNKTMTELARNAARERLSWRLAFWMLRSGLKRLKQTTDWKQYGGAPILGFEHLVIKAHGRSNERAIFNALKVAARCVEGGIVEKMKFALTESIETVHED